MKAKFKNHQSDKLKKFFKNVDNYEKNENSNMTTASGNFEKMCHDAPANRFIFRWSN